MEVEALQVHGGGDSSDQEQQAARVTFATPENGVQALSERDEQHQEQTSDEEAADGSRNDDIRDFFFGAGFSMNPEKRFFERMLGKNMLGNIKWVCGLVAVIFC